MDLSGIVKTLSEEEFTTGKNVIAGTSEKVSGKIYLFRGSKMTLENCEYIPAINKVIDELIVNVVDHFVLCVQGKTIQHRAKSAEKPRFVDVLAITIYRNIGKIVISNTGYGIPIIPMEDYGGIFLPEVLFSKQRTGTNMDHDENRITGGTNGIGATIVAAFSKDMTIEIKDKNSHYLQSVVKSERTENRRKISYSNFQKPTIAPNKTTTQFTKITFTVDWKNTKYKGFNDTTSYLIISYVLKRLIQASLYTNHIRSIVDVPQMKSMAKIMEDENSIRNFNDYNYDITDTTSIATMFNFFKCFLIKLNRKKPSSNILTDTISVIVGVNNRDDINYREMSIVNGVEVTRNPFMKIIREYFLNAVKNLCKQKNIQIGKTPKGYFTLLSVMCLANPQWVGQTKEEITVNKEILETFDIASACNEIKEQISDIVYEMILCNNINSSSSKTNKILMDTKTYTKCNNLNEKHKRINKITNYIALCEGTSARSLLSGVQDRGKTINHTNTGLLTTSGVPINVYHQISVASTENMKFVKLEFGEMPKKKLLASTKVLNNNFFKQWNLATGLNDEVLPYQELRKRLNYDVFICATDSDYDGWNIAGLFIVLLSKYEGLLENGHLRLLHLPVIRIIPRDLESVVRKEKTRTKTNILSLEFIKSINFREYFTIRDYEEDIKTNPVPSSHIAKFYKGLASTEEFFKDVIAMDIKKYIYTIVADSEYKETLKHYYGKFDIIRNDEGDLVSIKMSDKRKEILRKGIIEMTQEEKDFFKSKKITITTFLRNFVGQYYLDNIKRKLLGLMDGLNEVMRKIIFSLVTTRTKGGEAKVSEIAGRVSVESSYHHGQASLEGAILNFGQDFHGARLYPPFIGSGLWGSILDGGKSPGSAGSARYITATANYKFIKTLFRSEDNIILEHQESEGKTIEPKFFLPIIPFMILENYGTAAHGWKCEVWGRSFNDVIASMLKLFKSIQDGTEYKHGILDIEPRNGTSYYISEETDEDGITKRKNIFYSKGAYTVGNNEIHITGLPIGVWINDYVEGIRNKIIEKENEDGVTEKGELSEIVQDVLNRNTECVDIVLKMFPDWRVKLDKLAKKEIGDGMDPIEQVFRLKIKLTDNLNFLDIDGSVLSFTSYEDALVDWFYKRLNLYRRRISRAKFIIELKLVIAENKIKYLKLFDNEKLYNISEEDFAAKLISAGLCKLREINFENNLRCNKIPDDKIFYYSTEPIAEDEDLLFDELVKNHITTYKISFQYLKSIRTGSISKKGIAALEAERAELLAKYEKLKINEIDVWKSEIKELLQYRNSN
jgi:DNA topoisomerase-2